jgi:hypothetical protein
MSENGFLRQKATSEIIENVASFCAECYSPLSEKETIFYDMKNYRYLCSLCQETIQGKHITFCEPVDIIDDNSGLFI